MADFYSGLCRELSKITLACQPRDNILTIILIYGVKMECVIKMI
jgi:hypothetical protein